MDVIELIAKLPDEMILPNGPKLHDYIKEMNKKTFGDKDMLTVGECWCADIDIAKQYSTRIIGLRDGNLVFDGTPEELTAERIAEIYGTDMENLAIEGEKKYA